MSESEAAKGCHGEAVPRWGRVLLVALLALALLARLALAIVLGTEWTAPRADSEAYLDLGLSIADGKGFERPAGPHGKPILADRMPGYPLVIAAAEASGQGPRALAMIQTVLGVATMILAMAAAWRLAGLATAAPWRAGFWAGLVAAALLAFDPFQVWATGLALPEVALGLALAATVAAGARFIEAAEARGRAWPWAMATGAALALAAYLDIAWAGLAIVAGVAALIAKDRRRFLSGWALGAAVLIVALAPWAVRNAVRLGSPVLVTSLGERLYLGTGGDGATYDVAALAAGEGQGLDEVGRDGSYLESAGERIARKPWAWLGRMAARGAGIWSPEGLGGLALPPMAGYTSLLPMGLLALAGVWVLRRRRAMLVWLLAAPAYMTVAYAALGGGPMDRLPVAPALAILGGVALAAALRTTGCKQPAAPLK